MNVLALTSEVSSAAQQAEGGITLPAGIVFGILLGAVALGIGVGYWISHRK